MAKIVLEDARVVAALDAIQQRAELCDASGRVLGFFVPHSSGPLVFYKGVKSPYSREELDRRFREEAKDAKPLSEFWTEMKAKHPDQFP